MDTISIRANMDHGPVKRLSVSTFIFKKYSKLNYSFLAVTGATDGIGKAYAHKAISIFKCQY